MKALRKICVIFFAVSVLFAAAANAQESNTDIEKLAAFGIIEEDFAEKEYITRADLAKYAVRMYNGADNLIEGSITPFKDVTEETDEADYIATAYALGFVNGTASDMFSPSEPASLSQAAKIMVNVAGYGQITERSDELADEYYARAVKLGFFKGVKADAQGRITPDAAAKLFTNVLETDAAELITTGKKNEYKVEKDVTVLQKNLKIYKNYGLVEADGFTSIYGGSPTGDNYVEIDGTLYLKGKSGAETWLGYNTEFYCSNDNSHGENEILYIMPRAGRNTTIELDAADIASVGNYKFNYYTDDGKTFNSENYSKSTVCILNRKQVVLSSEALQPKIGRITLIDNDGDGNINVIKVSKYDLIIAGGAADGDEPLLTDRKTGKNVLKDAEEVVVSKNGKAAAVSDICEKDVVLVEEAQKSGTGKKYVYLYVSDETISGILEEIEDDYVTIGGDRYRTRIAADTAKLGCTGEFRQDIYGAICSQSFATDRVYGFVKSSEKKNNNKVNVKIFTENDRFVVLELADRVKHNGSSRKKSDFYSGMLAGYVGMVTYRVNEDGKIYEMNTPQAVTPWTEEHTAASDNDIFRLSYELTDKGQYYRESVGAIGAQIPFGYFGENTKVFAVPSLDPSADDDDFAILTKTSFYNDERLACNVSIYDNDEFNNMGACMLVGYTPSVNWSGDPALITDIKTAVLNDGGEHYEITCMVSGNERKYYTDTKDITLPKKGSIALFNFNPKGFVKGADVVYDAKDKYEQYGYYNGPYSTRALFKGKILTASSSERKFAVDFNYSQGPCVFSNILNPVVFTYSVTEQTAKLGSEADLIPGRYCFVKATNLRATTVIVFTE